MTPTQNILVVGGAGYIGSHTVLALRDAGLTPVVYDNFSTGHRDAVFSDELIEGELSDTARLPQTMRDHNIDAVVHFAALIEAGQSVLKPLKFYRNNVANTISLLEAMQVAEVAGLVFSSTAAVYGSNDSVQLLHEDLPIAPVNPYGQTKAAVEAMLQDVAATGALRAIALRYFNAAGCDPKLRTGERHDPETHLIPLVLQAALGLRDHITVYGSDYDTPDGTCLRDYIHVSDLARGHVAAVRKLLSMDAEGGYFRPINLGTGQGHSVRAVIDASRAETNQDLTVIEGQRRPGDPARLIADVRRAHEELNWHAERSDITKIIHDASNYMRSQIAQAT
jgi:UDP-glucose-4-epimerase GalE